MPDQQPSENSRRRAFEAFVMSVAHMGWITTDAAVKAIREGHLEVDLDG